MLKQVYTCCETKRLSSRSGHVHLTVIAPRVPCSKLKVLGSLMYDDTCVSYRSNLGTTNDSPELEQ
jgi:hypothetical protein